MFAWRVDDAPTLENDETANKYAKTRIDDHGEIETFRESVAE